MGHATVVGTDDLPLVTFVFHVMQAFTDVFVYEEDLECQAKVAADLEVGGESLHCTTVTQPDPTSVH